MPELNARPGPFMYHPNGDPIGDIDILTNGIADIEHKFGLGARANKVTKQLRNLSAAHSRELVFLGENV